MVKDEKVPVAAKTPADVVAAQKDAKLKSAKDEKVRVAVKTPADVPKATTTADESSKKPAVEVVKSLDNEMTDSKPSLSKDLPFKAVIEKNKEDEKMDSKNGEEEEERVNDGPEEKDLKYLNDNNEDEELPSEIRSHMEMKRVEADRERRMKDYQRRRDMMTERQMADSRHYRPRSFSQRQAADFMRRPSADFMRRPSADFMRRQMSDFMSRQKVDHMRRQAADDMKRQRGDQMRRLEADSMRRHRGKYDNLFE